MSHCLSANGSWSGTRPARAEPPLTAARSAAVRCSTSSLALPPLGILPTGRLRAAPTRARWPAASRTKAGLLDLTVGHADLGVLFQDGAAGGLDGGSGGGRERPVGVGDDVLAIAALELTGGLGLGGERHPGRLVQRN